MSAPEVEDVEEHLPRRRRGAVAARVFDTLPGSPRVWSAVALVCLAVSAVCVLLGFVDVAFVVATLGVLAWFVNVRNRMRGADIEEGETETDDD